MRLQLLKTLFLLPLLGLAFAAAGEKRELSWTNPTDNSYKIVKVKTGAAAATFTTATELSGTPAQVEATHNVFVVVKVEATGKEIQAVTVAGANPQEEAESTLSAGEKLYKFTMPNANAAITVALQNKKHALTWVNPADNSYKIVKVKKGDTFAAATDLTSSAQVEYSQNIFVVVKVEAAGKEIQSVTVAGATPAKVEGEPLGEGEVLYKFTMPDADAAITVALQNKKHALTWADPTDNSYKIVKVKIGAAAATFTTATEEFTTSPAQVEANHKVFVVVKPAVGKKVQSMAVTGAMPAKVEGETLGEGEELWKFDMPAAAAEVKVTTENKKFKLTWTAPTWQGMQAGDLSMEVKAKGSAVSTGAELEMGDLITLSVSLKEGVRKKIGAVTLAGENMERDETAKVYKGMMPAKDASLDVVVRDFANSLVTFASDPKKYTISMVEPQVSTESVTVLEGTKVAMKIERAPSIKLDNRPIRRVIATKEGETGAGAIIELSLDKNTGLYTFVMPGKAVGISVEICEIPHLTFQGKEKEYDIVPRVGSGAYAQILKSGETLPYGTDVNLIVAVKKELTDAKKQVVAVFLKKTQGGEVVARAARGSEKDEWRFSMPNEDVTIEVKVGGIDKKTFTFASVEGKYSVVAKIGSTKLKSPAEVLVAQYVTLTITQSEQLLNSGKRISKVMVGDVVVRKEKSDNLWSFGMPEEDAELKVEYEDINYRTLDFTPFTDDYKLRVITGPSPLIDVDPILKKVEPGREVIVAVNMTDEAKKAKKAKKVTREVQAFIVEGSKKRALFVTRDELTNTWSFRMPDANVELAVLTSVSRQLRFTSVADKYNVSVTCRGKALKGPFVDVAAGETLEWTIEPDGNAKKAGRTVVSVKLGDKDAVLKKGKWVIEMPDADAKLEVTLSGTEPTKKLTFASEADLYSVTAKVNGAEVTSPADVPVGTKVELTVVPVGKALAAGRTVLNVTAGAFEFARTGDTWSFAMPAQDITIAVTLSEVPAPKLNLTVVKGDGVEGAVTYTTTPAVLTGLEQKSHVTFHVTKVPAGKVLKIAGDEKIAGVRMVTPNQEYVVALGTENGAVTLSLQDAPVINQHFNITVEAEGADVTITADGATTDGKNVKKDAALVFTIKPKEGMKVDAVTFDGHPLAGDKDGKYETTMTNYDAKLVVKTSKEEKKKPKAVEDIFFASVRVAPNPFSDALFVQAESGVAGTYQLLSVVGQVVRAGAWNETELRIATDDLQQGIYLLRLTTERGAEKVFRVLKR